MPQELQCVQCCECAVFQSQIVKKIPKFSCALCGTKQSVRQVYALSNKGKEVRLVVQRLNAERGRREEAAACASPPAPDSIPTADLPQTDGGRREDWSAFIAPKAEVPQPRDTDVDDPCLVTCLPEQHQRKRRREAHAANVGASQPHDGTGRQAVGEHGGWRQHTGGPSATGGTQGSKHAAAPACAESRHRSGRPLQQQMPISRATGHRADGVNERDAFADGMRLPACSERPSLCGQLSIQQAQQPEAAVCLQAAADLESEGSLNAAVEQRAQAEVPLRANATSRWQHFALPPDLSRTHFGTVMDEDGASSAFVGINCTGPIAGVEWGPWLAQRDAPQHEARHPRSPRVDVTQRASAWQTAPHRKQSMQQSAATFVTTAD